MEKHLDTEQGNTWIHNRYSISVVVPLYNEEESVKKLVEQLLLICEANHRHYEVILVDDGSTDGTWKTIERMKFEVPRIKGIKLRRNFGQTNAMVAGFESAAGEIIVTMDGDLQNDPSDIPKLLGKLEEGYDIVSGWRKNRKDHFSRVIPSKVANWFISLTTGVRLHDYGCSLKAYRTECIKSVKAYGDMHRFFPALASMTGARVTEVPVKHHPRRFGKSKYGFNRIFKVFSDIFALNLIIRFSASPLKGFALASFPFVALTFFFGMLSITAAIFNWTAGKASFFLISAAICGVAVLYLLGMGLLAELVVGTSDLSHTQMPELTKKQLLLEQFRKGDDR
jgi:glycosyltransferase involved in cell wall biosynthesis